jgi:hypothetical protein
MTKSLASQYPHFEGTCCLRLQGRSAVNYSNVNVTDCIIHIYLYILHVWALSCYTFCSLRSMKCFVLSIFFFLTVTQSWKVNLVTYSFPIFHKLLTHIIITSRRNGSLHNLQTDDNLTWIVLTSWTGTNPMTGKYNKPDHLVLAAWLSLTFFPAA